MKVTMMLADFVEAINGKLYIMGGGWSITGPQPSPSAIALKIELLSNETNKKHSLKLELLDSDYRSVLVPTPAGNAPLVIGGDFEVGKPTGLTPGASIDVPLAFNISPILLESGKRYIWKLTIDGNSEAEWQVSFSTRPSAQAPLRA